MDIRSILTLNGFTLSKVNRKIYSKKINGVHVAILPKNESTIFVETDNSSIPNYLTDIEGLNSLILKITKECNIIEHKSIIKVVSNFKKNSYPYSLFIDGKLFSEYSSMEHLVADMESKKGVKVSKSVTNENVWFSIENQKDFLDSINF